MNSPLALWVILEEQRMVRPDSRRRRSVAHRATRPVRRHRLAALRARTAATLAAVRRHLVAAPATTRPVPGADVLRLPVGCSA
jgi:hypothetical protein